MVRNKVIVITGASSGFGRGAALRLAEEGAQLVLAARRKRLLKEVAEECEQHGRRAVVVECDVSDPDEVESLARKAIAEFGRVDVWVNDAGVSTFGRFGEVPIAEHEQVIRTNLLGTMYGAHAALRQFRKLRRGTLINIASYLGKGSAPYMASYVASKHGVRGLGMALRQELQANGEEERIHVCTVMPTSMDTPFFEHSANHLGHPVQPIPPVYDPQEVIETIVRLVSEPEDEVIVGRRGKQGSFAGKIAPGVVERKMARNVHKTLMEQEEEEGPSTGSLFDPMREGEEVRGGWLAQQRGKSWMWLAALAPAAVIGIAMTRRTGMPQRRAA
jgi:short-subunit dehydrogenase